MIVMDDLRSLECSMKIIKQVSENSTNIVKYVAQEQILRKSTENIFDNEAPKVQCLIACLHLGDYLTGYGDEIFEQMKKDNNYNISLFFSKLFTAVFPAAFSTMYVRYQKLKQDDLTIAEFSKDFKDSMWGYGV